MSFIYTADWHIKTKFREVPISWLSDRFLEWLVFLENERKRLNTDTLVIGGDLFDKIPTMFDMALFATIDYATNFNEIMIYPGNHEMLSKKNSFYTYLEKIFPQFTWITEPQQWRDWWVIPYPDIKQVGPLNKEKVMSHVRCASDRGLYDAEIDFSIFDNCDAVLLGDIHEHRVISDKIKYPGAPYDTTFTRLPLRNRYYFYVDGDSVLVCKRAGNSFKRLIKVDTTIEHYNNVRDKVKNSKHYYDIQIIVDSMDELDSMKGQDMVKVKLRETDDTYEDADTIEEEMYNYLVQVLGMDNSAATQVMTVYKELSNAD